MNDKSSDKKKGFGHIHNLKDDYDCDISERDVSSVTDMERMFRSASSFNQDIGAWDVSCVTDINDIFSVRNIIVTKFPELDRIRIPSFTIADVKPKF